MPEAQCRSRLAGVLTLDEARRMAINVSDSPLAMLLLRLVVEQSIGNY
jgi:hypothetical protein